MQGVLTVRFGLLFILYRTTILSFMTNPPHEHRIFKAAITHVIGMTSAGSVDTKVLTPVYTI